MIFLFLKKGDTVVNPMLKILLKLMLKFFIS